MRAGACLGACTSAASGLHRAPRGVEHGGQLARAGLDLQRGASTGALVSKRWTQIKRARHRRYARPARRPRWRPEAGLSGRGGGWMRRVAMGLVAVSPDGRRQEQQGCSEQQKNFMATLLRLQEARGGGGKQRRLTGGDLGLSGAAFSAQPLGQRGLTSLEGLVDQHGALAQQPRAACSAYQLLAARALFAAGGGEVGLDAHAQLAQLRLGQLQLGQGGGCWGSRRSAVPSGTRSDDADAPHAGLAGAGFAAVRSASSAARCASRASRPGARVGELQRIWRQRPAAGARRGGLGSASVGASARPVTACQRSRAASSRCWLACWLWATRCSVCAASASARARSPAATRRCIVGGQLREFLLLGGGEAQLGLQLAQLGGQPAHRTGQGPAGRGFAWRRPGPPRQLGPGGRALAAARAARPRQARSHGPRHWRRQLLAVAHLVERQRGRRGPRAPRLPCARRQRGAAGRWPRPRRCCAAKRTSTARGHRGAAWLAAPPPKPA